MQMLLRLALFLLLYTSASVYAQPHLHAALPSWRDGELKRAILQYIAQVSDTTSPSFTKEAERIAVFDNDGTLMAEKPVYFQLAFMIQQAGEISPTPWQQLRYLRLLAALKKNIETLERADFRTIEEGVPALLAGMTDEIFTARASQWIGAALHPRFHKPYRSLIYIPMLELLEFLRAHGFRIYICSGSDSSFLRAFSRELYGIPAANVIGSNVKLEFNRANGAFTRTSRFENLNLGDQKAINFHLRTGGFPIVAVGNADGDLEMLQLARRARPNALALLVRHDDAEREYAYDDGARAVRRAAAEEGWSIIGMKKEWLGIFPEDK